jgi:cellobiose epimerase
LRSQGEKQAPRAAVINARILWTYSAACRLYGAQYREIADWAYDYIVEKFWDAEHGGVYWMLDYQGNPISDRKQIYAQAFAAYGMAEYFRATGKPESLEYGAAAFHLIEEHSYEPGMEGLSGSSRPRLERARRLRLSEKDLNSPKSMNTHLHVMEAYTTCCACGRTRLLAKQKELLEVTMDRIVDNSTGHFKLFFDNQWNSLTDHVSFGHDIEGSWLILEAAEVLGDPALIERAREAGSPRWRRRLREGLDKDGSMFYEAQFAGVMSIRTSTGGRRRRRWWASTMPIRYPARSALRTRRIAFGNTSKRRSSIRSTANGTRS